MSEGVLFTMCSYCDERIIPGQLVVGMKDPDPSRALMHKRCYEMRDYDERLAATMNRKPTP